MEACVKVSSKYQIVIPKEIRQTLSISAGDRLILRTEEGKLSLYTLPGNMSEYSLGLHKDVWQDIDATDYVNKERETWE